MKQRTESNYYFIDSMNGKEEASIDATVRDYRGDDDIPIEKRTIDCYEICRITTTAFSIDFQGSSVTVAGIFMESVEQYFGCKWSEIDKMITDLYLKNYPVAGE